MKLIADKDLIPQLEEIKGRIGCPKCEDTKYEQGFKDGVDHAIHLIKFMPEYEPPTSAIVFDWDDN